jgi:hypothetical protein
MPKPDSREHNNGMRLLPGLAMSFLALTGCKQEQVTANVNCEVKAGPTVDCTIAETKGTAEVEICWGFKVTCANGATLEGTRTCAKVKDGQTANATIPTDKITSTGSCEGEKTAAVTNLTINGEKPH